MAFFYYSKNFAGKHIPVKTVEMPAHRGPEGEKRVIVNLVSLGHNEASLSLNDLMELYPSPDNTNQKPLLIAAE